MAFKDFLNNLFQPTQLKNEAIQTVSFVNQGFSMLSASGETYIRDGYKSNPLVYSIINYILREYCKGKYYVVRNGERIDEHPVLDLFNRPNPKMGGREFLEQQLGYKLITGDSFIHMVWPDNGVNAGKPVQMWPIVPLIVNVKSDRFGVPFMYTVEVNGRKTDIPAEEMIYFKYWNPQGTRGQSRLEAACTTLQQSNDAYKANMKLLQNTGASGILSQGTDDGYGDPMDEVQRDQLEARYYEKYGGVDNYGRIMITSANLKWQQIGLKAVDLALLESQNLSLRDLCNVFGLSSQLMNDPENSTYNNVREARKELISNIVIPEHELALGEYNRQLVPRFGDIDEIKLDTTVWPELEEDKAKKVDYLSKAYWMTFNEKRQEQGLEPTEDPIGEEFQIPNNLVPSDLPLDDQIKLLDAEYRGDK